MYVSEINRYPPASLILNCSNEMDASPQKAEVELSDLTLELCARVRMRLSNQSQP